MCTILANKHPGTQKDIRVTSGSSAEKNFDSSFWLLTFQQAPTLSRHFLAEIPFPSHGKSDLPEGQPTGSQIPGLQMTVIHLKKKQQPPREMIMKSIQQDSPWKSWVYTSNCIYKYMTHWAQCILENRTALFAMQRGITCGWCVLRLAAIQESSCTNTRSSLLELINQTDKWVSALDPPLKKVSKEIGGGVGWWPWVEPAAASWT